MRMGLVREAFFVFGECCSPSSPAVGHPRGSQLEVAVPEGTTDDGLYWAQQRFDRLRRRVIDVHVRRDESWRFNAKATVLAS